MSLVKHSRGLATLALLACMTIAACPSTSGPKESAEDRGTASQVCGLVKMNNIEAIQQLVDDGANIGARGTGDLAPLHIAAEKGYLGIAKLLVQSGADVNAKTKEWERSPILYAIDFGQHELAMFLLENGVDVNERDGGGNCHLTVAIAANDLRMCRELVKRGANPNSTDFYGETPLFIAARGMENFEEKLEILVEAGANLNAVNNSGQTALEMITEDPFDKMSGASKNAEILRKQMK